MMIIGIIYRSRHIPSHARSALSKVKKKTSNDDHSFAFMPMRVTPSTIYTGDRLIQ